VLAAAQKDDVESEEMQVLQKRFQDIVESRMQGELRSLKSEITKCGNSKEKKEWKTLLKEHRDKLKKLQHDMDMLRQDSNRGDLGLDSSSVAVNTVTNDEILAEADRIGKDDIKTMQQINRDLRDTAETAQNSLEVLEAQTEQIERINQEVHGFRGTIKRGGKLLSIYKRRIMTDRLIWVFLFLIVAGIVGLVIWTMVDPQGSSQYAAVPESVQPPTPQELQNCYHGERGSGCGQQTTAPVTAPATTTPAAGGT